MGCKKNIRFQAATRVPEESASRRNGHKNSARPVAANPAARSRGEKALNVPAARRVRPSPSLAWYSGPYMQSSASPAPATTADTSFTQPVGVRRKLSEQQVQILQCRRSLRRQNTDEASAQFQTRAACRRAKICR